MNDDFLKIGMKLTIVIQRENEELFFPSKIEDIKEDQVVLGMPIKKSKTFFVGIDENISIYFSRKGSFYCIDGVVKGKKYYPIITMHPLGPPYKKQKRDYYRLKISCETYIKPDTCDDWIKGYTQDISAGGVKFSYPNKIKKGSFIEMIIPEILGEMVLKAIVIRTERISPRKINPYDIAVEFTNMTEHIRDKIFKFIFTKQRELRVKGVE